MSSVRFVRQHKYNEATHDLLYMLTKNYVDDWNTHMDYWYFCARIMWHFICIYMRIGALKEPVCVRFAVHNRIIPSTFRRRSRQPGWTHFYAALSREDARADLLDYYWKHVFSSHSLSRSFAVASINCLAACGGIFQPKLKAHVREQVVKSDSVLDTFTGDVQNKWYDTYLGWRGVCVSVRDRCWADIANKMQIMAPFMMHVMRNVYGVLQVRIAVTDYPDYVTEQSFR